MFSVEFLNKFRFQENKIFVILNQTLNILHRIGFAYTFAQIIVLTQRINLAKKCKYHKPESRHICDKKKLK